MTEIMHYSPVSSSNDVFHQLNHHESSFSSTSAELEIQQQETEDGVLAVLGTVLRKSLVGCSVKDQYHHRDVVMEIGCPTNVRHVAHVTFDRFNGFLGLPVEFEPDVPRRPPSASTRVFGVSTESMQLSFDSRGNCVPTILLMMQRRLYSQGGLQSEGIFRINPENGQEEYVREELNNGLIPENIDVHCLAGLIKAWFRELPKGILDCLSPEVVMQANSEEDCFRIARLLPPTEAALLDWAIHLMADVAQMEHLNKMNARNIAMVFAPNMTQMSDPLTALMHAVQVMNFLKNLVVKTLRDREDYKLEADSLFNYLEPSDEDGHHSVSNQEADDDESEEEEEEPIMHLPEENIGNKIIAHTEIIIPKPRSLRTKLNQDRANLSNSESNISRKKSQLPGIRVPTDDIPEKNKGKGHISRVNSHTERVAVWR